MATPASGAISMNNFRTEITRATSSSISMSEVRTRYGGSGAISFNDLRKVEGFVITSGTKNDKFASYDGYDSLFAVGVVTPTDSNALLSFAANSWLSSIYSTPAGSFSSSTIYLSSSNTYASYTGFTTGFKGSDITRIVTANTSRTLGASANTYKSFTYDFPSSGTIHCLVKF